MYGVAIGAAIASNGDTQYIDNMAVTKCAHRPAWGGWGGSAAPRTPTTLPPPL